MKIIAYDVECKLHFSPCWFRILHSYARKEDAIFAMKQSQEGEPGLCWRVVEVTKEPIEEIQNIKYCVEWLKNRKWYVILDNVNMEEAQLFVQRLKESSFKEWEVRITEMK